jgi:hypothetical protein
VTALISMHTMHHCQLQRNSEEDRFQIQYILNVSSSGTSDNMVNVAVMSLLVSSSFSHFPASQFSPIFYFTKRGKIMFLILHDQHKVP